jgi:hypothetical protein
MATAHGVVDHLVEERAWPRRTGSLGGEVHRFPKRRAARGSRRARYPRRALSCWPFDPCSTVDLASGALQKPHRNPGSLGTALCLASAMVPRCARRAAGERGDAPTPRCSVGSPSLPAPSPVLPTSPIPPRSRSLALLRSSSLAVVGAPPTCSRAVDPPLPAVDPRLFFFPRCFALFSQFVRSLAFPFSRG